LLPGLWPGRCESSDRAFFVYGTGDALSSTASTIDARLARPA
jgi:hypothetical protein